MVSYEVCFVSPTIVSLTIFVVRTADKRFEEIIRFFYRKLANEKAASMFSPNNAVKIKTHPKGCFSPS